VPAYLRNNSSSSSESKGDGRTTTALRFALLLPLLSPKNLASVVCFISSSLSVVMSSLAAVAEARRRNGERSSSLS